MGCAPCYVALVPAIDKMLRAALRSHDDVALAVLFGSTAKGTARPSSDVDLGIRWQGGTPERRDALISTLERALARTVDLVELDGAPPQLRFEIARDGAVLVERQPGAWAAFRARAFIDWWDFRPIARRIHRAGIERLRASIHGPR
jgi:uncharacterized protein